MSWVVKGVEGGVLCAALIYLAFLAVAFLQAGSRALGLGVFIVVFTKPLFWILLMLNFWASIALSHKVAAK